MNRDFKKEIVAEEASRAAFKLWVATRIENIHARVSARDVLVRFGTQLKYGSKEEQFSCPFHGQDTKPSARVYEETARGPSAVWCFVCQEYWDAIRLWRKFTEFTGGFTALLREIESEYNIPVPESPMQHYADYQGPDTYALDEVYHLMGICSRRLKSGRKAFDFESFSKVSILLDRLKLQVDEKRLGPAQAKPILEATLDKIGARIRACPED